MNNQLAIRDNMSLSEVGNAFVKSGFFQDTRDVNQAIVKILAGREFGFGPFSSMTGVYIIQGRPSLAANLMAAAVKRSGRYDYRVREMTEAVCDIEFIERGDKPESLGHSRFTLDDAKKAGTKNLDKYPRNMLFARAMSNGVKWFCPDVFNGSAVYTPDELGAEVDEEGRVIEGEIVGGNTGETTGAQPASEKSAEEKQAESKPMNGASRPYTADVLRAKLIERSQLYQTAKVTDKQIGLIVMLIDKSFAGHDDSELRRHAIQQYLFGVESIKDAAPGMLQAVLNDWLKPVKDSGGDYNPNSMAVTEINLVYAQILKDQG